jgi:hypothetical protein
MKPYEVTEYNGQPARLYEDGSIRNEKGHWLAAHPGRFVMDESNASALAYRSHERKREIIRQTASEAVERDEWRQRWGSDAWIAAVTEAQYIKATTPDDPKSTDAARFLFKESGLSEEPATAADVLGGVADILRELAAFARAVPAAPVPDVIDAE